MPKVTVANMTRDDYERAAQEYLVNLPLEHFMEAEPQSMQRSITTSSFQWLESQRTGLHLFNELLVQYPVNGDLGQVVPDNMVVLGGSGHERRGSYNVVFEEAPVFWALEYVSPSSERKDYEESYQKYEQELLVPYYLVFHPEKQDLRLYRHTGTGYELVPADADGRLPIRELEMQVALLGGWVRYWYRDRLIPLPGELQKKADQQAQLIVALKATVDVERKRANDLKRERDDAERRAAQERLERETAERRIEQERQNRETAERRAEQLAAQLRALGFDPAA